MTLSVLVKSVIKRLRLVLFSVLTSLVLLLSGCGASQTPMTPEGTETETAYCDVWGGSLPSRSKYDTEQTQFEIGVGYDVFELTCDRPVDPD